MFGAKASRIQELEEQLADRNIEVQNLNAALKAMTDDRNIIYQRYQADLTVFSSAGTLITMMTEFLDKQNKPKKVTPTKKKK